MNHIEVYKKFFNYSEQDLIRSEISGMPANDIHHIIFKSQKGKDKIGNLIALTRDEHNRAHHLKKPYLEREELIKRHQEFIKLLK